MRRNDERVIGGGWLVGTGNLAMRTVPRQVWERGPARALQLRSSK